MMQSADLRDCDDPASIGRLHTARLRTVLPQCQICLAAMAIIKEHFEMPVQTPLVEYDYVIEALVRISSCSAARLRNNPTNVAIRAENTGPNGNR